MPKIIAYEVEINGIKEGFKNFDEIKAKVKELKAQLDGTDFGDKKFEHLQKTIAQLTKVQDEHRKSTSRMKFEVDANNKALDGSYRQLNAQLVVLRNRYKELSEAERDAAIGKTMLRDISLLDSKLKQIDSTMGLFQRNVGNYLGAINQFAASAGNKLGGAAGNIVSGIGAVAGAGALGAPGLFLALGAAVGSAVTEVVNLDAKMSDLQAGIQKTAGLSAAEVRKLTDELKGIDTRTTLSGLLDIGRVLGQFGIAVNRDAIAAIDKLNVAFADEFGDNAELITSVVGKLRNVFHEFDNDKPDEAFLRIGNALNELGATGAATAPVVADFATRLGGTLGQFNISAGNIFGVSATLEELGTTAERGATGLAIVFQRMTQESDKFSKVLKLTDDRVRELTGGAFANFAEVVNKDVFEAFRLVLTQVNELNLSNTQTAEAYKSLRINQQGAIEVIGKLAGAQDLLTQRLDVSNRAIKTSSSIVQEYNTVNNTLAGELAKLKNNMENAFVNTGVSEGIKNFVSWLNATQTAVVYSARALDDEKKSIQTLIYAATDVNTTQQRRIELINELQSKYPEYFQNLKAEEVTNLKLIEVLGNVNNQYNDKIRLLAILDKTNESEINRNNAIEGQLKAELRLQRAILDVQDRLAERGFVRSGNLQKDVAAIEQIFGSSAPPFTKLEIAIGSYKKAVGEASEARREDFTSRIQSFQDFDQELKINEKYNAQLLEQVAAFGRLAEARRQEADELEKAGKRQEAKVKLTNLELDAKQLLKKVDVDYLKTLKETADKVQHIGASSIIGGALTGVEQINTALRPQASTSTVRVTATKTASNRQRQAEVDTAAYFEQRLRAFEKFQSIYADRQISLLDNERDRLVAAERKKADDQVAQIDDTNRKLLLKQEDTIKKVNEGISKASGADREKLLKQRQELEKTFADDNIKLTADAEKAKQAIIDASQEKITQIEFDYEVRRREQIKRQQQQNLQGLNQYYQKLAEQITKDRRKFDIESAEGRSLEISAAGGDKEKIRLINYKYDVEGLKRTEQDILNQIKLTDQKIAVARTLNSVQTLLGLPPKLSEEALKAFAEYQDDLTLTLKEAIAKRDDLQRQNNEQQKAERKQTSEEFKQTAINEAFDVSRQLSEFFNNTDKQRLQDERDERLSVLDEEYTRRLELARGNAAEEARIQQELSQKKIAIERQYQEEQKKIARKQAVIAGALAVLQLFASPTPDYLTKLLLAGGLAIKTGIEIAAIDKQKFEKGGKAGTFGGNSHHYGGVQGVFSDGTRIEVEKDEDFFIINKRNSHLRRRLSAMNSYRGHGRKFAEGGSVFGEQLYYQSAPQPSASTIIAHITDDQMYTLAGMVAKATMEGTYQGAQSGVASGERINERYNEFNRRTNR